jgi:ABC transporter substrate binding protein
VPTQYEYESLLFHGFVSPASFHANRRHWGTVPCDRIKSALQSNLRPNVETHDSAMQETAVFEKRTRRDALTGRRRRSQKTSATDWRRVQMVISIGRRQFISAVGGAAIVRPLVAHAQRPVMPVVGFLSSAAFNAYGEGLPAFRRGLNETGFIDGQNVAIEYRSAEGQYDRLAALASDLVGRKVSVLVTAGGIPPALVAKAATTTVPIVFVMGSDPVKAGVVV